MCQISLPVVHLILELYDTKLLRAGGSDLPRTSAQPITVRSGIENNLNIVNKVQKCLEDSSSIRPGLNASRDRNQHSVGISQSLKTLSEMHRKKVKMISKSGAKGALSPAPGQHSITTFFDKK